MSDDEARDPGDDASAAPGSEPLAGPNGEPLSEDGLAFWDGSNWHSMMPPYLPLPHSHVPPAGLERDKRYSGSVVAVSAIGALILTSVVALVVGAATDQILVLLILPLAVMIASIVATATRESVRWRSIWMGFAIGAPFAVLLSGATCLSLLASSL